MIIKLIGSNAPVMEKVIFGVMMIFILTYSLSIHEFMHGYSAYLLGDDTAKLKGRLTMNPLAHLDLFGALMFLFVGFGWAKPVPVNYGKLTRLKSRGAMVRIVSIAGVTANFLSAWIAYLLLSIVNYLVNHFSWITIVGSGNNIWLDHQSISDGAFLAYWIVAQLLFYLFYYNLLLMAFNLLPFPPLDGYHILETLIPYRFRDTFHKYEKYFGFGFMALIVMGLFMGTSPLFWIIEKIQIPFRFIIQTPLDWLSPLNEIFKIV